MSKKLSHFDETGAAHMVDVGAKDVTARQATAKGSIFMAEDTLAMIASGTAKKGDVLGVARLAGIMAAKKTADLIPLCHPLPLTNVSIEFDLDEAQNAVHITANVKTKGQTGVEMEALTAVNVTALTIYDMVKAVDKAMRITDIRVTLKEGGKSGRITAK